MPTRPAYHTSKYQPARSEERPSAHARGYDRAWQKLREAHLIANPFCVFCDAFAAVVDHRVPIVINPSRRLDPTNLRSCCGECHNRLTNAFKTTGRNEVPGMVEHDRSSMTDCVGVWG